MSAEDDQSQTGYEDGLAGGPGAPTPLAGLEVSINACGQRHKHADASQGIAGLTKRDIQLFVDAGYNTVESVAYTYGKGVKL